MGSSRYDVHVDGQGLDQDTTEVYKQRGPILEEALNEKVGGRQIWRVRFDKGVFSFLRSLDLSLFP